MKTYFITPFFLLILFNTNLFAQNNYKGAAKFKQPEIEVLPNSTEYILDQELDDTLEIKLNHKIDEFFRKHNVAELQRPYYSQKKEFGKQIEVSYLN